MAATTPLIDAEVLREFFEKAEPFLTDDYLRTLSSDMAQRRERVRDRFPEWPDLWDLAAGTRRLPSEERALWQPRLAPLKELIANARVFEALSLVTDLPEQPKWLVEWVTFWAHLADPAVAWWARWVYGPASQTGALPLLLDSPAVLQGDNQPLAAYQRVSEAVRFLEAVLESTRSLDAVQAEYRPMATLAVVYTVYMFTMASWKLTEEFTQVLPPFPVVVRMLLGLNRWEGK